MSYCHYCQVLPTDSVALLTAKPPSLRGWQWQ